MNNTPILFNRKILDKYLSAYADGQIADYDIKHSEMSKWKKAVENSDLQKTKETSVQGKFLESVFEKVLGYSTFLDSAEYNQIQEFKSKLDGSEADGALGFFSAGTKIVRAAIELKDANTDLDKKQYRSSHLTPVEQAFGYAHKNGSGCGWVIVSNFVEIRLYKSSSSLEYEKFLITELNDEAEFKRFYFLLCKEHLIEKSGKSLVDRIYDDNEQARVEISNAFYGDYKKLRVDLFQALQKHNAEIDDMTLFSKSQKILDRFIFVCFCENKLLLPKGIFKSVVEVAKKSFVLADNLLWEQLKGLFDSIDRGNPRIRINGYNGGLFEKDGVLDGLAIPDKILERFTKLTEYDYDSELNVNILGHIFEQGISDLEQFKAELAGTPVDRRSSKQKTDGIFYTPDYVTKFIVEKTVGRWLDDEKARIKRGLKLKAGEVAEETAIFWEGYIESLKAVKVLDPACGSGAFLNQAFDYLCEQGNYAVEMRTSLSGGQASLFDWDTHILQNNLFGVDLNTESVEITKLSLWLKTARSNSELVSLDATIKCGNSIINSREIVGERAFDWNAEFPAAMGQGGFDVVVGNPPYGAALSQAEKDYIAANYGTTEYNFDTYKTFMELGLKLTRQNGYMGYITPNTFFVLEKGANKLRRFLFEGYTLLDIVELFNVFPAAVVEPAITVFQKKQPDDRDKLEVISVPRKTDLASTFIADGIKTTFEQKDLREREGYLFNFRETEKEKKIIDKINGIAKPLSEYFAVSVGVRPYGKGEGDPPQTAEVLKTKPFEGYEKIDDTWFPYIRGKNFNRYVTAWGGEYVKYGKWLARPRTFGIFVGEKLFIRQTSDYPIATYDASGKVCKNTVHCIYQKNSDNPHQSPLLKRGAVAEHCENMENNIECNGGGLPFLPRNKQLKQASRDLRTGATKQENHLWYDFLRSFAPRFTRQRVVNSFILDFYCHEAKLAVELDGSQHYEEEALEYDKARTEYLNGLGIRVLRFANTEVDKNFAGVCAKIAEIAGEGKPPPSADGTPFQKGARVDLKYVLGLINSRLMKWVFQHDNFHIVGKPLAETKLIYVERLPIVVADDQSAVISLVDGLLENCQARFDKAKQFTDYLSAIYAPKAITEKLSEFYNLDFKGFVDEMKRQKAKLAPKQEMELMPLFREKAGELVELSQVIERLDNKLDEVVFALYSLTAEERAVVEGKN